MTTVNRKVAFRVIVGAAVGLLGGSLPTRAEDLKCKLISMMVKVDVNNIEDQKGHMVGIYERKGITIYDNGDVAEESNHGWFDGNDTASTWQGYCLQKFKDGSTMIIKYQGSDANDKIVECNWEFVQGTGRYEGIKGKGIMTGSFYGKFEYRTMTGTYTVKK